MRPSYGNAARRGACASSPQTAISISSCIWNASSLFSAGKGLFASFRRNTTDLLQRGPRRTRCLHAAFIHTEQRRAVVKRLPATSSLLGPFAHKVQALQNQNGYPCARKKKGCHDRGCFQKQLGRFSVIGWFLQDHGSPPWWDRGARGGRRTSTSG